MKSKPPFDAPNQRNHERHPLKDKEGFYVLLSSPQHLDRKILGQVIDVSLGGLAFRYMETGKKVRGSAELLIYRFEAQKKPITIPCQVIYDDELPNTFSLSPPIFHRCGVRFVSLTTHQKGQLEGLIQD